MPSKNAQSTKYFIPGILAHNHFLIGI